MIRERDEEKVRRAMLVYRSFNFSVKVVMEALGIDGTNEAYGRIWKAVQDVARSESTLNVSAAEAARNIPHEYPKAQAAEVDNANRNVRQERELAQMILDASKGFSTPPPAVGS